LKYPAFIIKTVQLTNSVTVSPTNVWMFARKIHVELMPFVLLRNKRLNAFVHPGSNQIHERKLLVLQSTLVKIIPAMPPHFVKVLWMATSANVPQVKLEIQLEQGASLSVLVLMMMLVQLLQFAKKDGVLTPVPTLVEQTVNVKLLEEMPPALASKVLKDQRKRGVYECQNLAHQTWTARVASVSEINAKSFVAN